jgi:hypothetical protein
MEDWYTQQIYYSPEKLTRIKAWMAQDVIDIFAYNVDTNVSRLAIG